jgi:hypothetical protein
MSVLSRLSVSMGSKDRCAVCGLADVPLTESAHLALYCERCSGRLRGVLGSFAERPAEASE